MPVAQTHETCTTCGARLTRHHTTGKLLACDHGASAPAAAAVPAAAAAGTGLSVVAPATAAPTKGQAKAEVKSGLLKAGYSEPEAEQMAAAAVEKSAS